MIALSYPDAGLGEHNYCRNPDNIDGLWCYNANSADPRWDYCDIPVCSEGMNHEKYSHGSMSIISGADTTLDNLITVLTCILQSPPLAHPLNPGY